MQQNYNDDEDGELNNIAFNTNGNGFPAPNSSQASPSSQFAAFLNQSSLQSNTIKKIEKKTRPLKLGIFHSDSFNPNYSSSRSGQVTPPISINTSATNQQQQQQAQNILSQLHGNPGHGSASPNRM